MDRHSEEVDNAALDFDLLDINEDGVSQINSKQTRKRKDRQRFNNSRPTQNRSGLEKVCAPDNSCGRHQKQCLRIRELQVKMIKGIKHRPTNKTMTQLSKINV